MPPGNPPLPAAEQKLDANRNGLVERTEATGATADQFAQIDANRDGMLSGAEVARGPLNDVHLPTTTFTDRHTVTLGGKRVEMISPWRRAHADDSAALYFPDERTVFNADVMQVRRLPGGLAPTVGSWIEALRTITALDFDDRGHRARARRAPSRTPLESLRYLEDLSKGVAAGVAAGQTLAADPEVADARRL